GVQRQGAVGEGHRPGDAQSDGCGDGRGGSRDQEGPGTVDGARGDVEGSAAEVQGSARSDRHRHGARASGADPQRAGVDVDGAGVVKGMPTTRVPVAVSRVKVLEALLLKALVPPPLARVLLSEALKEALFWKVPLLNAN